jgi:hypothetical protein
MKMENGKKNNDVPFLSSPAFSQGQNNKGGKT